MRRRSTETNLVCITQHISNALDRKGQLDVVYTDFQKAFDRVNHDLLLSKLDERFGFSPPLVRLINSYLTGRTQVVECLGCKSLPYFASSGVPQGSVLGPLLFLLFINDLTETIECDKLLYADDLKLFSNINTATDCSRLQRDLDTLVDWCLANDLHLNVSKCYVVTYSRKRMPIDAQYTVNGHSLERLSEVVDLGVAFDSKLSFARHIESKVASALTTLGFIVRNCSDFKNHNGSLVMLFNALIRSKLEYCSIVWYPLCGYLIADLERVQRKFLKFLSFRCDGFYPPRNCDHNSLLSRFLFNSLAERRFTHSIVFLFKVHNYLIDSPYLLQSLCYLIPRLHSRTCDTFYCASRRTNVMVRSPILVMCRNFNRISKHCDLNFDSLSLVIATALACK